MRNSQQKKGKSSLSSYFKNLSNKDKIILCATLGLIVVFMAFSYIFIPSLDNYLVSKDRVSVLDNEKSRVSIHKKQNEKLKVQLEEIQKVYEEVVSELPKTPQTALILKDIQQMALLSSVNMSSISVSEPEDVDIDYLGEVDRGIDNAGEAPDKKIEDKDKVKKQSLYISIEGDYNQIKSFIEAIENYDRISEVSDISITKVDKTVQVEVKPEEKPETNNPVGDNITNNIKPEVTEPQFQTVKVGETLSVSITANFYNLNYEEKEVYDFNNGNYGKENSFKQ